MDLGIRFMYQHYYLVNLPTTDESVDKWTSFQAKVLKSVYTEEEGTKQNQKQQEDSSKEQEELEEGGFKQQEVIDKEASLELLKKQEEDTSNGVFFYVGFPTAKTVGSESEQHRDDELL